MKRAALLFLFAILPARAAELEAECAVMNGKAVCMLAESDLDQLVAANKRAGQIIAAALQRIHDLEESKKVECAKTEVTEPPKPKPGERAS